MKKKNKQLLPILACGTAFALWGLNTPFIKTSLLTVPIFILLFAKYFVGATFFTAISYKSWKPVKKQVRTKIIIATILGYALTSALMYKGIEMSGGLSASLIYLLAPLILYFSSIRFLKEKYNSRLLIGVVAGFIGAVLIMLAPILSGHGAASTNIIGNLLVFLAVLADVAATILIKPAMGKISAMQITSMRFIIAGVVMIPFALAELHKVSNIIWNQETIIAVGYNLIFATIIGYFLFHWGYKKVSGEQLSPLHYLDPLFGAVGSIVLLSERPSATVIIGIVLIGSGLYFGEAHKLKIGHHIAHHR